MFCAKCGSNLPDSSQFCLKCGSAIGAVSAGGGAATAVAPAKIAPIPRRKGVRTSYVAALLLVMVFSAWYVISTIRSENQHAQSNATPSIQMHQMTFGAGAITVAASRSLYYKLPVPEGATIVKVRGHFRASGGRGNDIVVSVLREDDFQNWQNGHEINALYNSGQVTAGDLDVALPNGAGNYYLIFNNKFSLITPKAIEESIALTYYTR